MLIDIKHGFKAYQFEDTLTQALDGITFALTAGEFVSIMGPSGCGKSTLLNIMGLLDVLDQGSYIFSGTEVIGKPESALSRLRRNKIGFVFQSFNLIDSLSVFKNVMLSMRYSGLSREEREHRANASIDRMGLSHRARHKPRQLSGGQQQRAAIARAIAINPDMVLADEPTGNLDSQHSDEVMSLLTELNQDGTTIAMVTHSQSDAKYAQRCVHMLDGKIEY